MIGSALANGFKKSWQARRLLAFCLLLNFIMSAFFISPYMGVFEKFFKNREATDALAQHYFLTYVAEFQHYAADAIHTATVSARLGSLLFFLLTIFLAGGIVAYFQKEDSPMDLTRFTTLSGKYLGRMFRIFLIWLVLLLISLVFLAIFAAIGKAIRSDTSPASTRFYLLVGETILFLLVLNLMFLIVDYTKIILVRRDHRSVLKSLGQALYLFRRLPGKAYMLHLCLAVVSLILYVIQFSVLYYLPETSPVSAYVSLAALQIFVYLRWWMKWSYIGSQTNLLALAENR